MENISENRKIEIEQDTINDLNTIRKWTMFLAILGFIWIGLMIIIGLFAGVFLSVFNTTNSPIGLSESLIFIIVIIVAAIYFFPLLFLLRFSKHTASSVKNLDKHELHKAFKNLKAYYVYIGILVIILMSIYFIAFLVSGISVAFLKEAGTVV